ncbi:MFS transporter [Serratia fonticola]|uniref:MFS transporter n=1 Tax=Serratia fonticola TaxID=47917 RepID=UPI0034C65E13
MASKSSIELSPLALTGLALICGLSVANVYFNQALLPVFANTMGVSVAEVSWIATASQLGYALGILMIVPLGDSLNPYRLCRILLFWTALILGLSSVAESLVILAAISVLICMGTCIPQVLLPYIASLSPLEKRSRNIPMLQTSLVAGILLSRSFASFLSAHWGGKQFTAAPALACLFVP